MTLLIQLGIALICFFFSVCFSAAETALVSLSPQKSKSLAVRHPQTSRYIVQWLTEPRELLILILTGNTLSNVIFATVVTSIALNTFPLIGASAIEIVAWLAETIFLIILAEMAPKFFARSNPEKTVLILLPWLVRLKRLFRPIRRFIFQMTHWISWGRFNLPDEQILSFSPDEIKALLEERESLNESTFESLPMVHRALTLQERQAQNIMTPIKDVDFIEINPPGKPPMHRELLIDLIIESGRTRTPIQSGGQFIGFIHFNDLLPFVLNDSNEDISRFVRKAPDISAARKVTDLLQDFKTSGTHMGFVRDEAEEIIGIITLEDVLEEITGEILDEYDLADAVDSASL